MGRRAARNALFLALSQLVARGIGLVYFVFLARILGVETFGYYTLALVFFYNFIPVADLGIERWVLKEVSRQPAKAAAFFSRLLPLRIGLALLAGLGMVALGAILGQSASEISYLFVLGLALLPANLVSLIICFQNTREKMGYMAVANVMTILLTAIFGVIFVLTGFSLIWVVSAYLWANLLVFFGFWRRLAGWGLPFRFSWDEEFGRRALGQSLVFAALTVLAVFYLRLSVFLVGFLKGAYAVGLYGAAFRFVEAGILIPQSLALALFPVSARLFIKNREQLGQLYTKGLTVLLVGGMLAGGVMFLGARLIVPLIYGPSYREAVPVFAVLGLAMVLFFVNALPGNIIQNSPKVTRFLPLAGVNLVTVAILGCLLIPRWSVMGAAWTVVGGEMTGLVINNWFVWQILKSRN